MSIDHVRQCATIVAEVLRTHRQTDACADLERLIRGLDDADGQVSLRGIAARCDIDDFGALPVSPMPLTEWWAWLRRLQEACREELDDRQFKGIPGATPSGATTPQPGLRTPAPDVSPRERRSGIPMITAVFAAIAGASGVAASAYPAALTAGVAFDRPVELIASGLVVLTVLASGGIALYTRRSRPATITAAE
jgi:hypothetical protein